jgi:hypothetical protein
MCINKRSIIRHNYKQSVVNLMHMSALLHHILSLKINREELTYVCRFITRYLSWCLIIVQLLIYILVYVRVHTHTHACVCVFVCVGSYVVQFRDVT